MRYETDHKERSRERILHSAAKELRRRGLDVVRVTDVMTAAGMTNGGFYKHFENKEHLAREAVTRALAEVAGDLLRQVEGLPRGEALAKVIALYLSEEHLDHPDSGCAIAALGTEIARLPGPAKSAVSDAIDEYGNRLRHLMPGETDGERQSAFLVLFSSMAGCVMAARTHADRGRQRQILASARSFFVQSFCGNRSIGEVQP